MRSKERQHEYYLEKKARLLVDGLCMKCGKRKPAEDRKYCAECLKIIRDTDKMRRKKWMSEGKCIQCGGEIEPERQSKTSTCGKCSEMYRAWYKQHRKNVNRLCMQKSHNDRFRNGLCIVCGKPNDREERKMCSVCAEKKRQNDKNRRMKYMSMGLCTICGKPTREEPYAHSVCKKCRIKRSMRCFAQKEAKT